MFGLTAKELEVMKALRTPDSIQDFLDDLPRNYEKRGDTLLSPRMVMRLGKAHCIEGALFAAVVLWLHGEPPIILDLKASRDDDSHVVALYRRNGYYGAISKTNHASLRFRDPIYKNPREVALSYFHEYFLNETGAKTLRSYATFNVKRLGTAWITADEQLLWLNKRLDAVPHTDLIPEENRRYLRNASALERKAGRLIEYKRTDPGT